MRTKEEAVKLFEKNQNLVFHILNKKFSLVDYEVRKDLAQEGLIALYSAAQQFDESKGYKFSTYAGNAIFYAMLKYKERYLDKHSKPLSYEIENECNIKIIDTLYAQEEYSLIEINDVLEKIINVLNEKEKIILKLRLEGYTQREIGQRIGITQVYVSRVCINIRELIIKAGKNREITCVPKQYSMPENDNSKFSKKKKEVIMLREKGFKYREISEMLNIPKNSISSYLRIS